MNGWINGLMDGWMDVQDGQTGRRMDVYIDRWMAGWMDGCIH